MSIEIKRSVCPFDCPDTCGLLVEIENKKAVKIKGDPEHPFTRGMVCPKMSNYQKTVYSPDRLKKPLLRMGPKGSGQFKPISWEKAIEYIKNKWQGILTEYGPESILPYSYGGTMGLIQRNCGEAFFNFLGASQLKRTICSAAKGYGWSSVMGSTLAPHPNEVLNSDFIILWGSNALATNIHLLQNVKKAQKRGAKVWLIETHETPTAKVADKIIFVRPGSDGALALGMMHVMVKEGLINKEFIEKYVLGFEKLKFEILPDYTPGEVSKITSVAENLIVELARLYAASQAPFISLGSGLSRYGNGAMTVRTITCLPALVGAWEKSGGGLLTGISTSKAFNLAKVTRKDFLKKETRTINMNQLGYALNKIKPPIMSLYVYHSNPAVVAPEQNMVIKGLMREDLFTVVHERFMTDTARYADILLPATSSLEHSDLYRAYGHYCIQRAYPVIKPIGEAKSNWQVFQMLAEAMNFSDPYFSVTADELIEELLREPNPWRDKIDYDDLNAGLPVELPLKKKYKLDFQTPSGKIEIYNDREGEKLPKYFEPHGDNAPFWFVNAPSVYTLNSTFNERHDLVRKKDKMYLLMNPKDAALKDLKDNQKVVAYNERGEVPFILKITQRVPQGVVVAEGIFWIRDCLGNNSINALTSQRLTDKAEGSTFYDTKVDVKFFHS